MDRLTREEFEAEFEPRGYEMRRVPEGHNFGHYINDMTEGAWRGWQAALSNKHPEIKCPPGFHEPIPGVYVSGDDPAQNTGGK